MTNTIGSSTPTSGSDTFLVRGAIKRADGRPISSFAVKAYDKDLRSEQLLGETGTDRDGRYEIVYSKDRFKQAEKRNADLIVRVYASGGAVLAESAVIFNAREAETVDLIIDDPRSEYQRLADAIFPLLAGQGVSLSDLTEDATHRDFTFLAGETGEERRHIELFILSEKLSLEAEALSRQSTGTKAKKPPKRRYLGAEIFFGLIRRNLPGNLPALVARGSQAHRRALEAAIADKIIAARPAKEIDQILKRLQDLQVEQPVFLAKPEVLFRRLADLTGLSQEQADFITARLNERLRQEILKAVGTRDVSLSNAVQAAATRIDYRRFKDATLSQLISEEILAALRKSADLAPAIAEVDKRLADKASPKVSDLLRLESALEGNPIFADDLRRAKTVEYARLVSLDDRAARKLIESNLQPRDIKEGPLRELVKEGVLTEGQKTDLLLALDLGRLTGDNFTLVEKVKRPDLKSMADFASWQKADWQAVIESEAVSLPLGETPESYAGNIFFNIELTYPSQVLLSRLRSPQPKKTLEALDGLNILLDRNERLIDGEHPAALDWSGINAEERQALERGLRDLASFTNTYRHLGMANLINDKTLDLTQKKGAIEARLTLLDTFFDDNPDLDLRFVSLTHKNGDELNWQRVPEKERPPVKKQLRAWQRVMWLGENTVGRQLLMSKGYDSAFTIVAKSESEFVRHINNPQPHLGLAPDDGRRMYERALDKALVTAQYFGFIRDLARGNFTDIRASNVPASLINDLRDLDSFDDLFGPQDYCDCEHCRSIFSPAAYFVDLMHFIDTKISQPVFESDADRISSALYLKNRRSDLWTLPLTCENTDTLVPYLTIVNEVLETYLNAVVGGGDIYARLAGEGQDDEDENLSFSLPFTLPLEEMRLYLSHFGMTLHDIYRILGQPQEIVWRARLNLSEKEFGVITRPHPEAVRRRFGNPISLADFPAQDYSNNVDIDRRGFIKYAGISREQLDELLSLDCNPGLANIGIGKLAVPDELQNFPEILNNLTDDRLDFIHRFIRLWKKTPWSIPDLDLILTALRDGDVIGDELDEEAVLSVAQLVDVQEKLKLTAEELAALVDQLPRRLYERLFDPNERFAEGTTFHHYALNTENPNDREIDAKTPLLLAGLGISETELLLLIDVLGAEMGFDEQGNTILSRKRISLLYRHARLARALKLSIEDLIQTLRLIFPPDRIVISAIDQLLDLIDFRQWLRIAPFTISTLCFVLKGEENSAVKYKTSLETVGKLIQQVQAWPPEADRVDALMIVLAEHFNLTSVHLDHALQWVVIDIHGDEVQTALSTAFDENGQPTIPAELNGLLDLSMQMERVLMLFDSLKFKETTIEYLTRNRVVLGIDDLKSLMPDNVKTLAFYKDMATLGTEAEPLAQTVLNRWPDGVAALAELWEQDKSLIESLTNTLNAPDAAPMKALELLWERLNLCLTLGINGYSLQKLTLDDLREARDVVLGAFSVKYNEEPIRREKLEPYQDRINVIKRDALCDYIIARERELKFKDLSDIYAHFLLDVEMSGCFRISRVVCATSSLQLYVHRVLASLEQSASDGFAVPEWIPEEEISRIKQEWEWRKNYRVWEANRKVFLYPENYLEPDLRDNKTPIFKELEDELLQEKITKEAAEAAYKKYVAQFAQLARLRIAGSYYHDDTYYFFGRTAQDPPQYFYRKWVGMKVWTPWEKVELTIDSDRVSAIIHLGKLYLFWITIKSQERMSISDGYQEQGGFDYEIYLNFSCRDEKGKWLPAQTLTFYEKHSDAKVWPNQQCFPGIGDDNAICIFWHHNVDSNDWSDVPMPECKKLDLFRNTVSELATIPERLLISNGYAVVSIFEYERKRVPATFDRWLGTHILPDSIHESVLDTELKVQALAFIRLTNLLSAAASLMVVGSTRGDLLFTYNNQQYLIRERSVSEAWVYVDETWYHPKRSTHRISTSLSDALGEILFTDGLEAFLSVGTQEHTELPVGIDFVNLEELLEPYDNLSHLGFRGAYGEYYRELFLHIPFLIANQLNANQKFEEAKWWYERIFDPAASEPPDDAFPQDRTWRYIEFRRKSIETMKDILVDKAAIEQYKTDPFNPHAIARERFSAYQKAIVMKYIDNLLDWGDYLFAQDTMESINEATMLYMMAADILGKRPIRLGKCDTGLDETLTYPAAKDAIGGGSEFLLILENQSSADEAGVPWRRKVGEGEQKIGPGGGVIDYLTIINERQRIGQAKVKRGEAKGPKKDPGIDVVTQSTALAFCIPSNDCLRGYWDRVEDRLFKIRHCMNISGVRRQLALFAPPIEPMALVQARAAGLSLEDILGMMAAAPPPYRFSYLIEKARQFTQTVQSFGNALLSALEKKDVEELTLLRSVHERDILRMTRDIKTQQLCEAQFQLQAMVEAKTNVQNRIDYYQGLIGLGLTGWEITQQASKHIGTNYKIDESGWHLAASIAYLIPQAGSPFSMNFGGRELGNNLNAIAGIAGSLSAIAEAISSSVGLEGSFQRREEEWTQQLTLAQKELDQVEQQRLAADARVQIAVKDREIHEKNIEQADELDEFYKGKFTSLGLYTHLSITLNRLYRQAYNVAHEMALMAQRAYQFERDEDTTVYIAGDNWQPDRAGLLAGERLLLQLQQMEKAHILEHTRDYEVTQSFSLALLDPRALNILRETGSCRFTISEILFDLFYPGQYKRLIKSVRLTIPCVAGPYTNISAKLSLIESDVRTRAKTDDEDPEALISNWPMPKQGSIATSSAQSDGGLFELSFRDERYLPFEGAGAISQWKLDLPSKLRMFDYDTISDVIIHISYTAKDDGVFRNNVEDQIAGTLRRVASEGEGLYRLFSLRHEFPNAFHLLLNPPPGARQATEIEVTEQHFPYFLTYLLADPNQRLELSEATVYLKPKGTGSITTSELHLLIDNTPVSDDGWNILTDTNLREGNFSLSRNPIGRWTIDAGVNGFDKEILDDILILVKYTISQ